VSAHQGPVLDATVSPERCVGVASAVLGAPGAFALDDAGLSVFLPQGDWTEAELVEAAGNCPSSAIIVRRDGRELS